MSVDTSNLSRAEIREQAREMFRQSLAVGMPMTGRALGEQFGMSERWGQEQVAAVREEANVRPQVDPREANVRPQEPNVRPHVFGGDPRDEPQEPHAAPESGTLFDAPVPQAAPEAAGAESEPHVRFSRENAASERDPREPQTEPQVLSVTRENEPAAARAAASEPREAHGEPQEPQAEPHDPGLRDVGAAARSVLSGAAIGWLTRDRTAKPQTAQAVPAGAKFAGAAAAGLAMLAALAISYVEVAALGRAAGMEKHLSWLLPMTADGLLLTGLVTAWVRSRRGERVGFRPVLALIVGGAATIAANVAARWFHVDTGSATALWAWIPPVVAGYVPLAAALAAEQALALIRGARSNASAG